MENIKNRYKSKSYYKSITEIAYTPVYIYDKQYLLHKKGEVETTKFLGITFYKKVFDDDIYSLNGDEYTKSEIINSQAKTLSTFILILMKKLKSLLKI